MAKVKGQIGPLPSGHPLVKKTSGKKTSKSDPNGADKKPKSDNGDR